MNKLWVSGLAVIALICSLSPSVEASVPFIIDNFTTSGSPPPGWSAGATSQAQVADPTDTSGNNYSLLVTGSATKTYPAPGKDWLTPGYTHVGLFVYGSGGETLGVTIVEGDFVSGAKVDETWTWAGSSITPGWQYVTIPLPNFSLIGWSHSGGDGIWNPRVTVQEDGFKSITFIPSSSLYLDEITASVPGDLEVDQIFPANGTTYMYRPEIINSIYMVPPTFSAVISGTNLSLSDSRITIAKASQPNVLLNTTKPPPNTPNSGTTFYGIFATPNINLPLSAGTYNIFVTPIDNLKDIGYASVSTFTLKKETLSSPIKTLYHREVTQ